MGRIAISVLFAAVAALAAVAGSPQGAAAQEVVAARTLRAGAVLVEGDLRPARGQGEAAQAAIAALVGLETRRAIYSGRPVLAADLGPPTLVRRNAVVVMLFNTPGLDIRAEGRALESGGAGEVVRVINTGSRQPVLATVTGANRVEVRR